MRIHFAICIPSSSADALGFAAASPRQSTAAVPPSFPILAASVCWHSSLASAHTRELSHSPAADTPRLSSYSGSRNHTVPPCVSLFAHRISLTIRIAADSLVSSGLPVAASAAAAPPPYFLFLICTDSAG